MALDFIFLVIFSDGFAFSQEEHGTIAQVCILSS